MSAVAFDPFVSFIDPGFWTELSNRKLKLWQLDDSQKTAVAGYVNHDPAGLPCRLSFDYMAFDDCPQLSYGTRKVIGNLVLTNTIEKFRDLDRKALANQIGQEIWSEIVQGQRFWMQNASVLTRFIFTTFADLKHYHYYYWVCTPALSYPSNIRSSKGVERVDGALAERCVHYSQLNEENSFAFLISETENSQTELCPLTRLMDGNLQQDQIVLVFADPSSQESNPGWPLRNLLAAIAFHKKEWTKLKVLCLRQRFAQGKLDTSQSILLEICWDQPSDFIPKKCPNVVGWERNDKGQLEPRFVNMSSSMDPVKIAENAMHLNLELMRWRLVPDIDLGRMRNLRCLLFGAGTLGCNIARSLLAWGVKNLTLIDNANVSASNPVRQSLFSFEDSLDGGRPKSEAAVDGLRRIFPGINARGINLTVPMPGHPIPVNEEKAAESTVEELISLIKGHDVIFLLMDSREARWLPTLLASAESKIAMTVALGFDSYVIIRHGIGKSAEEGAVQMASAAQPTKETFVSGGDLACYFCSDITAPGNSIRDRTLDQQCTVTRPGVSQIAAGLAVELLATIVQHPLGPMAPAPSSQLDLDSDSDSTGCLGSAPHQIRGYISRFNQMTPCVRRFEKCVGCGQAVVRELRQRGWHFLKDAFNDPNTLERLAGLEELQTSAKNIDLWEFSDNESVKSMDALQDSV